MIALRSTVSELGIPRRHVENLLAGLFAVVVTAVGTGLCAANGDWLGAAFSLVATCVSLGSLLFMVAAIAERVARVQMERHRAFLEELR